MVLDLVSHNEEEGKIEFHLDALSELLEPHKEKLISVISISGAFRTGKSFLQNWVLKYLECGSAESFSEFLQNEENAEETVSGFKSIRTREPVTDGIDIFSEIFEFEHSVHGAVVVVVLDTQGIFSMNSDYSESVAIFAISLLLSSMQLYNIRGNMTRNDLEHLRLFASFGKMIMEMNPTAELTPFQHLAFVIRDWDLDDELGLEAGTNILLQTMQDCSDSEEGAELVQSIKTSFKKLICSTMRHPGSCLRDEDFEGQLGRMDDEFRTTLEELIPYVCNDSTDDSGSCPVIKTDPMENNMTCDDFIEQVNMLKEVFESGQIESPESLYSAYSKVSHGKAKMDEFDDKVKCYQKETWNIYDSAPKLEASEMEEELRKNLSERMEEDIENQRSENLNREALFDKTWQARCACFVATCACCTACACK
ncbi:unnamed protein product [Oikopleura dioica]|uniref:GB1/RHD3-type G domain-containing protein n=1 Tax=Oikopleura dioica TaxID=34765 RepID=E4XP29_OIKDI|nr:unnamed protein product [Oikopleura dioica]